MDEKEKVDFSKLKKVEDVIWKMEKHDKMNVPAYVVGTDEILEKLKNDKTLWQLKNVASLPGIVKNAVLMPDAHEGYGFPIGGVAAFDAEEGIVSPGGVGYDINCGVRLIKTGLTIEEVKPRIKELVDVLFETVPTGVGSESRVRLSKKELERVGENGIDWALENGFAFEGDKERIEEYGMMEDADMKEVSKKAKERGKNQLGTLGAGNHFLEVQYVESVDDKTAKSFGLKKGQIVVMVHCGSRGFGHQIASDYIREFIPKARKLDLYMPDLELVYLPIKEEESERYLKAMKAAVNFAFVNRQVITSFAREAFDKVFGEGTSEEMELVYDVAHNIAKFEKHEVEGEMRELLVHRKGATRAFPAGREELPDLYKKVGQPVLIPGSMGTASYVLVGNRKGMELSFGSSCHGAGRVMSRRKAKQIWRGEELIRNLWERYGIYVRSRTYKVAAEEAPKAYKDVDIVAKSVEDAGISKIVAKLRPLGVIKG